MPGWTDERGARASAVIQNVTTRKKSNKKRNFSFLDEEKTMANRKKQKREEVENAFPMDGTRLNGRAFLAATMRDPRSAEP